MYTLSILNKKFDGNIILLWSKLLWSDRYDILYMAQQLCCCGMFKMLLWYDSLQWRYTKTNFQPGHHIAHVWTYLNSLRPRPNRCHFADDIFKCIFENENEWISSRISLKFVPKVRINNIPALVEIMAWRRPGDKPLSGQMMVSLLTHTCVTRPQWVKRSFQQTAIPPSLTIMCLQQHNIGRGTTTSLILDTDMQLLRARVSPCDKIDLSLFCHATYIIVLRRYVWSVYPYSSGMLHWHWVKHEVVLGWGLLNRFPQFNYFSSFS